MKSVFSGIFRHEGDDCMKALKHDTFFDVHRITNISPQFTVFLFLAKVIGVLGTDSITKSPQSLLAKCQVRFSTKMFLLGEMVHSFPFHLFITVFHILQPTLHRFFNQP